MCFDSEPELSHEALTFHASRFSYTFKQPSSRRNRHRLHACRALDKRRHSAESMRKSGTYQVQVILRGAFLPYVQAISNILPDPSSVFRVASNGEPYQHTVSVLECQRDPSNKWRGCRRFPACSPENKNHPVQGYRIFKGRGAGSLAEKPGKKSLGQCDGQGRSQEERFGRPEIKSKKDWPPARSR